MSLPRKSYARRVINLRGWLQHEMVQEVMCQDKCDEAEASRRVDEAIRQQIRRSVGQERRRAREKSKRETADYIVLFYAKTFFDCRKDIQRIARIVGWNDLGKVFREIVLPLERQGLLCMAYDDERFVGYTLTDAGLERLKILEEERR